MAGLKARNVFFMLEGQGNVIHGVDESFPAAFIYIEAEERRFRRVKSDALRNQIDCGLQAFVGGNQVEYSVHLFAGELHGQQTVFHGVATENIGKAGHPLAVEFFPRSDDAPVAVLKQGPYRVFPARSAAEIVANHQDRTSFEPRLIEFEIVIKTTVVRVAPIEESVRSVAGSFD